MTSRSKSKPAKPQGVGAALVEMVATYESDTFSASRWSLSRREAEAVAERLIKARTLANLDGVGIRATLDEVRGRRA